VAVLVLFINCRKIGAHSRAFRCAHWSEGYELRLRASVVIGSGELRLRASVVNRFLFPASVSRWRAAVGGVLVFVVSWFEKSRVRTHNDARKIMRISGVLWFGRRGQGFGLRD